MCILKISVHECMMSNRSTDKSAKKCDAESRSVRVYISALFAMYTILACGNVVCTVYNVFGDIPYVSRRFDTNAVTIICIVVPRLIITLFCWATFAVFMIPMATHYKVEPDLWLPDFMPEEEYPTVDVMLPRYMESWDLYKPTVYAALTMNYPKNKLTVYVCDDGSRTDPVGQRVNAAFPGAVRYVTRHNGEHAKAGNLNNALKDATGDLVVVFDADMNAHPDYLLRTVPHLLTKQSDAIDSKVESGDCGRWTFENIAFVQTRQEFYNSHKPTVIMMDGRNSIFYNLMMPSFNGMGCALCVGTCYTMRRAALNSVGGFFTGCTVEDVFTALVIHEFGWTSKYIRKEFALGLSPETIGEFNAQRQRWIAGNAQMTVYFNPMTRKLPLMKRVAYLGANWYWAVLPFVTLIGTIRMALWATNNIIIGNRATSVAVPLFLDTVPIFFVFMLLPATKWRNKVCSLLTCFFNIPIYLVVTGALLRGRLNPSKYSYRVKASSEALGSGFPMLALVNVGLVATAVATCVAMMLPEDKIVHGSWDYVVIASFTVWTLCWNFAVFYVIGNRVFSMFLKNNATNTIMHV